jgi:alkaline phosphatase D
MSNSPRLFTLLFSVLFLAAVSGTTAQTAKPLIAGPMPGNMGMRTATVWVEADASVKKLTIRYHPENNKSAARKMEYAGELGKEFNPVKFELNGLELNTTYRYSIWADGTELKIPYPTTFTTNDLWQYRKPAPDFSFLTGSCAYFNEPAFDRPGKPYGGDSSIFETMAATPAAFHVWLGDNWYTREVDYESPWGLNYRASRDRSQPVLQRFLASMPQYAIWDDHDYGPNDHNKSYIHKEASRRIFSSYTCNPSYGENGKGIYTKISHSDVDIFLTDDRYFRSAPELPDSIENRPNSQKTFFGKEQMEWLKNALLQSKATFKIIAVGSQVLNPYNQFECFRQYASEYRDLMDFLQTQAIPGVLFFSGDRHHSEVIRTERPGTYPLFDVTISPYTSGVARVKGAELNNPFRMEGTLVEAQNFGKVSITGKKKERKLQVDFLGIRGEVLASWSVGEQELKNVQGKKEE